ncbi:PQQ-binding-like beta-propeller repeat protein [uncultured Methanolobus sp.]|uniref:outer membrane protein assembly factor BamB family protein n=1 Tax=uncultured Methanolobus sp. TaxID=218300 RepID=UPI002AAAA9AE|nr:PQQ-binding-like beta-propeller repeat protein [uncultured Methanolobus sp.]
MTKRTVFMLLLSIGLILGLSSVACASDWPTFQKNNYNNGVVDGIAPDTTTATINEVWTDTIGGAGWVGWDGAPIIANGTVYEVYFNGYVYAYNLTGAVNPGEPLWVNSEVGGGAGTFELSTAAYDTENDVLFVALSNGNSTTDTSVHAINGVTGDTIWTNNSTTYFPASYQFNSGIKYDDGKVYVASCHVSSMYDTDAGHLTCLDASTGVVEWDYHCGTGGFYWATPAIIGDYVVIGCDDGYVRSFDKDGDGTVIEYVNTGHNQVRGGITYDEDSECIFLTTEAGYLHKYDFDTDDGSFSNADDANVGTRMTTTPTVAGDFVYVVDDGATISCYEKDLTPTSSIDITNSWGGIKGSPVVYDAADGTDYVYVTINGPTAKASCVSFDEYGESPAVAGTFGPLGYTLQGVAIVDGYIVFGNDAKYLGCFK